MSDDVLVGVAVGLVMLYLLMALFCTAIQEWIAQLLNLRARHLQAAIKVLLSGSEESNEDADAVLQHPIVRMLAGKPGVASGPRDPSYLPARNFVDALLAKAVPEGRNVDLAQLKESLGRLRYPEARRAVAAVITRAEVSHQTVPEQVRATLVGLEAWYDAAMDHASGWYKRKVRWFLLAIALVMTVVTNADSIHVGLFLAGNTTARNTVATLAATTAPPDSDAAKRLEELKQQAAKQLAESQLLSAFGPLPVGWGTCGLTLEGCSYRRAGAVGYLLKLVGLLLTAVAASLGAPFWFGLLQQLNAIRAAGPKPASRTAEG